MGATRGVGTALVPLLVAAGVRVVATATAADADLLRALGAEDTIGYTDACPRQVDVAFNLALPGDRLAGIAGAVRTGGRLFTITHPLPVRDRDDIDVEFVLDLDGRLGGKREVAELAASGALPVTIGRRYVLDEGPKAWRTASGNTHHGQARRHGVTASILSTVDLRPSILARPEISSTCVTCADAADNRSPPAAAEARACPRTSALIPLESQKVTAERSRTT
ncbi:zinc-binding alcohol dehydrogenase family protein [Lentzea atacamensis]|uniref:Zinc-binding alcohol dehydrogenase family protein n=1 Tax=Lentzea atacamensis TaxID=531938 RepID=A0A316HXJ8_9PSEU|nr:zinc-binding dehydrogenase [Lentzea atacamensis]PWK85065.1 zinc-binding alcohol dehydrogenase family protein [Lentzea atacamensis]